VRYGQAYLSTDVSAREQMLPVHTVYPHSRVERIWFWDWFEGISHLQQYHTTNQYLPGKKD
jgi:hypothetical protein